MRPTMVVTGGSRGIGAAVVTLAARHGYAVCLNYETSVTAAEELLETLSASGVDAIAVRADVASEEQVRSLFDEVDAKLGPVDVLVNNAGVIGRQCRADGMTAALLERTFAVNVFGTFYASQQAIRRMSTKRGGRGGVIVNISSGAARHGGVADETHYAASKGAVESFTIALAREVAREGIRVNGVRPGLITTDIHAAHGGQPTLDALAGTVPLGRIGGAGEVAEAVVWLASDAASYVHGVILDVSGGR